MAPVPYANNSKVIIYGTSITQGGCATRPGMAYTNVLSRRIPLEFVNEGFSGNGRGEPEVARVLSEISDPALLVLDYEANVGEVDSMLVCDPQMDRQIRWCKWTRKSLRKTNGFRFKPSQRFGHIQSNELPDKGKDKLLAAFGFIGNGKRLASRSLACPQASPRQRPPCCRSAAAAHRDEA